MNDPDLDAVANLFRFLADGDFKGASPLYEHLTREAADDPEILSLLLPAAPRDRLPHLLLTAVHYLLLAEGSGALDAFASEPDTFVAFRSWCLAHRSEIEKIVATHYIQTNEVGRCAALLPCLSVVADAAQRPLAIVEVGTSAGLNLLFDRYRYDFGAGNVIGAANSDVVLRPRIDSELGPTLSMPEVVWRRGLDRRPIDVTDDDAVRWLRACIWPEQQWRADLLERAVVVARRDPPTVVTGDAIESLPALVRSAPEEAAVCIVHSALLPYFPRPDRFTALLAELAQERPLWWVSGEAQGLIPQLPVPPPRHDGTAFVYGVVPLGVPGEVPRAVARAGPHGAWLEWLDPPT